MTALTIEALSSGSYEICLWPNVFVYLLVSDSSSLCSSGLELPM